MISSIRKVEKQLGKFSKEIQGPEKKLIKLVRRGVYAKKNILKGEIITHKNSNFLRPSSTLDFTNLNRILGKKVKKNINVNQKIEIF